METSANIAKKCFPSLPVDIGINNGETCTFRESSEEWHELEQFWGDPRHRLQDFDSQAQQLSSSLERHLLFDECIQKPEDDLEKTSKDDLCFLDDSNSVIRGEEINDIPTQYTITGFKPDELIVIGFKYKVRKNLTEKYLFQGKALRLEQIGLGYGKRLTFQGPRLNNNPNYFWSDSCSAGFGFTLSVINEGDIFSIYEPLSNHYCGRVFITAVKGPQVIKSSVFGPNGQVEKCVDVEFICNVVFSDPSSKQVLAVEGFVAQGTVLISKKDHSSAAEVEHIELSKFVVDDCLLKPEN